MLLLMVMVIVVVIVVVVIAEQNRLEQLPDGGETHGGGVFGRPRGPRSSKTSRMAGDLLFHCPSLLVSTLAS